MGRFISADSLVPNPGSAIDFDRYAYAAGNPLRYIDPSGHCYGDPNDPNNPDAACWEWINTISSDFDNIWIDPQYWTAAELEAVWQALIDHPFLPEILEAESMTLHRRGESSTYYPGKVGGETVDYDDNPGVYDVYIYDDAYVMLPDGSGTSSQRTFENFRGTVAHEMAHVAIYTTPSLVLSYQNAADWTAIFSPLGERINWAAAESQVAERIALTAGMWEADPNLFTTNWVFGLYPVTNFGYWWIASYAHRYFCMVPVP